MKYLRLLGVELIEIENPWGRDYPIGNKISAMASVPEPKHTVFLDSDILCLERVEVDVLTGVGILAKPADVPSFGRDDGVWVEVYGAFGLELPPDRIFTTRSKDYVLPYFNAGVVGAPDGPAFGRVGSAGGCRRHRKDACPHNGSFSWISRVLVSSNCVLM